MEPWARTGVVMSPNGACALGSWTGGVGPARAVAPWSATGSASTALVVSAVWVVGVTRLVGIAP